MTLFERLTATPLTAGEIDRFERDLKVERFLLKERRQGREAMPEAPCPFQHHNV